MVRCDFMITKGFIEKIHYAFDELNYHESKWLDFDTFSQAAAGTISHCKDLIDVKNAVKMMQFCGKKWNKIEKIFDRKLDVFNQYTYEGNSLITTVSDEEACGRIVVTNGITGKINGINIVIEDDIWSAKFENNKYYFFEDGSYYLKYSKMCAEKMKLFNLKDECLCNIVLSKNCSIFLENNLTPYELVIYDDFIGIYDRKYYKSLAKTDTIDTDKLLADIEWDILDKKSDLGIAQLTKYESDLDVEMLVLFAMATFLVFQNFMKKAKMATYLMFQNFMKN